KSGLHGRSGTAAAVRRSWLSRARRAGVPPPESSMSGPGLSTGAWLGGLLPPAAVGPRPDQAVALAVLVIEEVGVDRVAETRIVQLQAQILTPLVRAFRPGGADLRAADQDPVRGRVLAIG